MSTLINALNFEAGTGSPTAWGATLQAGESALGTGSTVWTVFGTAYASAPISIVTTTVAGGTAGNNDLTVGSISTGSFFAEGTTASEGFYWMSLG